MLNFVQVQASGPWAYAPEGKANPPPNFGGLTTPYDLPDLRGRHEYIYYFEDKAKASLRAKC